VNPSAVAVGNGRVPRSAGAERYVLLTPGMSGADGIAAVSRLIVRAVGAERVLSLGDHRDQLTAPNGAGLRIRAAGGHRLSFMASALRVPPAAEIICLHLGLGPVAWLAGRGRARLTVFLHGIEAWRPVGVTRRFILRQARLLVANSAHTARRFRDANPGLAGKEIRVCHLGIDPDSGTTRERAAEGVSPFALIVGRMAAAERYKGHDLLLDIWPKVVAEVPDARLVVAGDGDDRARLAARAADVPGHVTFLGHVADDTLWALYRDCAFFVMPSRDEGFGLVFLEAMRAGKACIGGVGAASEVIEDGVTGLVVDPARPEPTLEAIRRLFREPGTRARMGAAGADRFARHFTEGQFRQRFRSVFGLPPEMR
jgi:phosphatidylinositol alpha-1,6-mannosyltransferase